VHCNLYTGEDVREVPGAEHYSCTIEMSNLKKRYDVAVIDEIQVRSRLRCPCLFIIICCVLQLFFYILARVHFGAPTSQSTP